MHVSHGLPCHSKRQSHYPNSGAPNSVIALVSPRSLISHILSIHQQTCLAPLSEYTPGWPTLTTPLLLLRFQPQSPCPATTNFLTWPDSCFSSCYTPVHSLHSSQRGPGKKPRGSSFLLLRSFQWLPLPQSWNPGFPMALPELLCSSCPDAPLLLASGLFCIHSAKSALFPGTCMAFSLPEISAHQRGLPTRFL